MVISLTRRHIFHLTGAIAVLIWIYLFVQLYKDIHAHQDKSSISTFSSPESSWFEIFFKGKKIGYLVDRLIPTKTGYTVKENLFIKVAFLGYPEDVNMNVVCDTDKNFVLKKFDLSLIADKLRFHISGIVKGRELIINRRSGGKGFQYKIYLLNPPVLGISMFPYIRARRIAIGDVFSIPFLDPTTMGQHEIKVKVMGKEKIKIKNIVYTAYRLETEIWGNPVIMWVDPDGRVLRQQGLMGLVITRSNPQDAMANMASPDLYNIVSIKADKKIPDPRALSYLKVRINGGQYNDKVLEIKRVTLPKTSLYEVPYKEKDLSRYLVSEFNIECDSDLILKKAKEIAGKEKDPAKIVKKIVDWVYKHIEKRPVLSIPSALETLKGKVGDCNEHAVLVTALLRAVGIPARICVGLIYNNGYFFYHAWNEAYIGKWIPVDATLDQMPVDAAHILLFHGDIEKQIQLTRLLGNLEIKILEFAHDKANRSHKTI